MSDEQGVGTVMGLLWFMLLVGITGMAVDATNGFRNRTMLQATADAGAAALGGAIDLPNEATVEVTAVAYSEGNTPTGDYGHVLNAGDVEIGSWDTATRTLTEGGLVENVLNTNGAFVAVWGTVK